MHFILKRLGSSTNEDDIHLRNNEVVFIGRGIDNDIILESVIVSRKHCRLEVKNNTLHIEDLNSINKVYINGQESFPKIKYQLSENDTIGIGTRNVEISNNDNIIYKLIINKYEEFVNHNVNGNITIINVCEPKQKNHTDDGIEVCNDTEKDNLTIKDNKGNEDSIDITDIQRNLSPYRDLFQLLKIRKLDSAVVVLKSIPDEDKPYLKKIMATVSSFKGFGSAKNLRNAKSEAVRQLINEIKLFYTPTTAMSLLNKAITTNHHSFKIEFIGNHYKTLVHTCKISVEINTNENQKISVAIASGKSKSSAKNRAATEIIRKLYDKEFVDVNEKTDNNWQQFEGAVIEEEIIQNVVDNNWQQYEGEVQEEEIIQNEVENSLPNGLKNIGNSCYANSVIQVLFHTTLFRQKVVSRIELSGAKLTLEIKLIFINLLSSNRMIDPTEFINVSIPSYFSRGTQHDCCEYLIYLLNNIFDDNENWKNIFEGEEMKKFQCENCKEISSKKENFLVYFLSIPSNPNMNSNVEIKLNYLLESSFESQVLNKKCLFCQNDFAISKSCISKVSENILIISLKIFSFDHTIQNGIERNYSKIKFQLTHFDHIEIPIQANDLDILNMKYELYAVIFHSGMYIESGHYVVYIKSNSNWYFISDEIVKLIKDITIINHYNAEEVMPYILFYEKLNKI